MAEAFTLDEAHLVEALRGDRMDEDALRQVAIARARRRLGDLPDHLGVLLDLGDRRHVGDPRRYLDAQLGPDPIDVDPATMAELGLTLVPASTVRMDRPIWTWHQRVPVGGVTLMAGREGHGKTALACWLMARLTRGQLQGHWWTRPADVVYIGVEDDRSTVLVPRLAAAGADLKRVQFVDLPDGMPFSVGVDTPALVDSLRGRNVALVVLDPLDAHLRGVDTHKKAEVQQSVARLAQLAQTLRCGALGLGHVNKGEVRDLLTRIVGSVGFTTSVRSVLGIGEHPDDPEERICVVAKANMTDRTAVPALRFRVEGATVDHPDGGDPIDTGLAVILGEELGIDPDAVIDRGSPADRSALDEAVDWLGDVLADGPQDSADVKKWAKAADISERTLKRALTKAGVTVTRRQGERGRPTVWELTGFRANGYGPTGDGPQSTPTLTSGNTPHSNGSGPSPGDGPKPLSDELDHRVDEDEW